MRLQISMGVAQKRKRPPKHFYTGFAGGVHRDPAGLESYKEPQAHYRTRWCIGKGMNKAHTRGTRLGQS